MEATINTGFDKLEAKLSAISDKLDRCIDSLRLLLNLPSDPVPTQPDPVFNQPPLPESQPESNFLEEPDIKSIKELLSSKEEASFQEEHLDEKESTEGTIIGPTMDSSVGILQPYVVDIDYDCGQAHKVFDEMLQRDVGAWEIMVNSLAHKCFPLRFFPYSYHLPFREDVYHSTVDEELLKPNMGMNIWRYWFQFMLRNFQCSYTKKLFDEMFVRVIFSSYKVCPQGEIKDSLDGCHSQVSVDSKGLHSHYVLPASRVQLQFALLVRNDSSYGRVLSSRHMQGFGVESNSIGRSDGVVFQAFGNYRRVTTHIDHVAAIQLITMLFTAPHQFKMKSVSSVGMLSGDNIMYLVGYDNFWEVLATILQFFDGGLWIPDVTATLTNVIVKAACHVSVTSIKVVHFWNIIVLVVDWLWEGCVTLWQIPWDPSAAMLHCQGLVRFYSGTGRKFIVSCGMMRSSQRVSKVSLVKAFSLVVIVWRISRLMRVHNKSAEYSLDPILYFLPVYLIVGSGTIPYLSTNATSKKTSKALISGCEVCTGILYQPCYTDTVQRESWAQDFHVDSNNKIYTVMKGYKGATGCFSFKWIFLSTLLDYHDMLYVLVTFKGGTFCIFFNSNTAVTIASVCWNEVLLLAALYFFSPLQSYQVTGGRYILLFCRIHCCEARDINNYFVVIKEAAILSCGGPSSFIRVSFTDSPTLEQFKDMFYCQGQLKDRSYGHACSEWDALQFESPDLVRLTKSAGQRIIYCTCRESATGTSINVYDRGFTGFLVVPHCCHLVNIPRWCFNPGKHLPCTRPLGLQVHIMVAFNTAVKFLSLSCNELQVRDDKYRDSVGFYYCTTRKMAAYCALMRSAKTQRYYGMVDVCLRQTSAILMPSKIACLFITSAEVLCVSIQQLGWTIMSTRLLSPWSRGGLHCIYNGLSFRILRSRQGVALRTKARTCKITLSAVMMLTYIDRSTKLSDLVQSMLWKLCHLVSTVWLTLLLDHGTIYLMPTSTILLVQNCFIIVLWMHLLLAPSGKTVKQDGAHYISTSTIRHKKQYILQGYVSILIIKDNIFYGRFKAGDYTVGSTFSFTLGIEIVSSTSEVRQGSQFLWKISGYDKLCSEPYHCLYCNPRHIGLIMSPARISYIIWTYCAIGVWMDIELNLVYLFTFADLGLLSNTFLSMRTWIYLKGLALSCIMQAQAQLQFGLW